MKIRNIMIVGVVLLLWIIVWFFITSRKSPESPITTASSRSVASTATTPTGTNIVASPAAKSDPTWVAREEEAMKPFQTAIRFWGRVIDEKGNPVPGALVQYQTIVRPMDDKGPQYEGKSDSYGLFSIDGIKGAGLYIALSKDGFYTIPEQSERLIGYGIENGNKPPAPDNPAIFVLCKKGEAEALKAFSSGGIRVPKNGEPVEVSLTKGMVVPAGQGDIQVEVWTQDQQKDEQRRYHWQCRISVPGGGLVERKDNFDFMAPVEGYKPAMEISMDQSAERWQKGFDGQYFAKLKDGTFARFTLNLTTRGDHFFMIESYHNPTPGSRNLEFDPAKAINNR